MWRTIGLGAGGLVLTALALWVLLVVSLRTQFSPFLTAIRRMNRALWNPKVMQEAGRPGANASMIHHVGRKTGTAYRTPVGLMGADHEFVIALPYGTSPDWLKNVLTAGSAVVVHDGEAILVEEPKVLSGQEVGFDFRWKDKLLQRLYGIDQFLSLRRAHLSVEGRR